MSPPPRETITAALAELRIDGRKWRNAAVELEKAQAAASQLGLGQFEFSTPASWAGVTEVYQQLQQRLVGLLSDGATALHTLGTTVLEAADLYEAEDNAGAHRIRGVW